MQLKTILNRVTNYKSFVVGKVKWVEDSAAPCLEVEMRPRANGHAICSGCGGKVERVPWAEGKSPLTTEYQWFLARWARRMSWKEVAEAFRVSWDSVYRAVKQAVSWGLEHRNHRDRSICSLRHDLVSLASFGIEPDQIVVHAGGNLIVS